MPGGPRAPYPVQRSSAVDATKTNGSSASGEHAEPWEPELRLFDHYPLSVRVQPGASLGGWSRGELHELVHPDDADRADQARKVARRTRRVGGRAGDDGRSRSARRDPRSTRSRDARRRIAASPPKRLFASATQPRWHDGLYFAVEIVLNATANGGTNSARMIGCTIQGSQAVDARRAHALSTRALRYFVSGVPSFGPTPTS